MNHNIVSLISDKSKSLYRREFLSLIRDMSLLGRRHDEQHEISHQNIVDYMFKEDFDKELFTYLFTALSDNIGVIETSYKNVAKLVYYRDKLGLCTTFISNKAFRMYYTLSEVEEIVRELKELGINSAKSEIFYLNFEILRYYFPKNYDNVEVLSYICTHKNPCPRNPQISRFYEMVEESKKVYNQKN